MEKTIIVHWSTWLLYRKLIEQMFVSISGFAILLYCSVGPSLCQYHTIMIIISFFDIIFDIMSFLKSLLLTGR